MDTKNVISRDITEQKNAFDKLNQDEERYRQIINTIDEVFWQTDVEKNKMLFISKAYEKIWGRTCQSLYDDARNWLEAIHPDDREAVLKAAVEKQVQGTYDEEYRIRRPDGQIRWIHDKAFPLKDSSGKVTHVTGVAQDITELKVATNQLKLNEKRYKALTENSVDVINLINPDGVIIYSSPSIIRDTGYRVEDIKGINFFVLIHPIDMPHVRLMFSDLIQFPSKITRFEIRIKHQLGHYIWIKGTACNLTHMDEIKAIVLNYQDYSKQKIAQEEVMKLASIIESTDDAVITKTLDGIVTSWNKGAEKMFGFSKQEILGQSIKLIYPNEKYQEMLDILTKIKNSQAVDHFESKRQTKDGKVIDVSLTVTAVKDHEGNIVGAASVIEDITESKLSYQKLKQRNDELEKLNTLMVGRELKMVALKKEIEELKNKLDLSSI